MAAGLPVIRLETDIRDSRKKDFFFGYLYSGKRG